MSLEEEAPAPVAAKPAPAPVVAAPPAPAPAALAAIDLPEVAGPAELAPLHEFVPPAGATGHQPEPAAAAAGDALLREALSRASREMIERVVWEVVPQLAETIIRENLERLAKAK